jgi:LETM1 and EF-hand domain-containing protein 1, mitochondrial
LKVEEAMKKEVQMRLAVAKFMQETLQDMAEKKQRKSKSSAATAGDGSGEKETDATSDAQEVIEFIEKARRGEHIPNDAVVRISKLFKDELTLNNVTRPQLVSMCQYMGLQPYGTDSFLRYQLRSKLRAIQDDDRRILWEGIDSLNTLELREACTLKS